jgi:hypothetical protein
VNFSDRRFWLTFGVLMFVSVLNAHDAHAVDWPQEFYNPSPDGADVVLPMPCGGAMAFRKIIIPNQGPVNDYSIKVGDIDDEYGYAENVHDAFISGSFDADPEKKNRFFLLGKYEVNKLQYESLGEKCPKPSIDQRLPVTEVDWFQAVSFADRYSRWLRKNAAEALPKDGKELGFARLPTEVEWEFAARGGTKVTPPDFRERVFPMPEGMVRYVWFEGPDSANGRPQFIGLLKPNPLGLHDILGNVDEMVLDPFRLNRLNRLHGQAGGFVVRGGNYFTPKEQIRTAYRTEVPYYTGPTPRSSKTTGFRIAIVAPVISSRTRLSEIKEAWSELGSETAQTPSAPSLGEKSLDDPVKELAVIAEAATDPNMKTRLGALQKELKNIQANLRVSKQERDDQRKLAAKASLRLGAFLCRKLADDGSHIDDLEKIIQDRKQKFGAEDERAKRYEENVREKNEILRDILQYYAETVMNSSDIYDQEVLASQLSTLNAELEERGVAEDVTPFANQHYDHLVNYMKTSRVTRSSWLKDCKLLE